MISPLRILTAFLLTLLLVLNAGTFPVSAGWPAFSYHTRDFLFECLPLEANAALIPAQPVVPANVNQPIANFLVSCCKNEFEQDAGLDPPDVTACHGIRCFARYGRETEPGLPSIDIIFPFHTFW